MDIFLKVRGAGTHLCLGTPVARGPFFAPVLRTDYIVSLGTAFIDFTIQNCSYYELLGDSENELRY